MTPKTNESIAVHSGKDSEKIEAFVDIDKFSDNFRYAYNNGYIHGCYYDGGGNVVAQYIWGEIETDVLTNQTK